ncbi:HD-GYP domain-containing protein [Paracerasibacillus soli]|uniref:HD-GYP domain-containing protein n=1 Tax=Paracerasibacillus soli TaxID=480284 RepID=A0ABU5CQZ1_9BACI|nr:HD-GYP domain-containing protein [Virgibacillus soli]MDY0408799.1 HD-GYP domain-containing protein [Virgibacillus soli]
MKLVSTNSIEPGATLGQSLYNDNGLILIHRGTKLTQNMLNRLLHIGITYIYIEDEFTKDIETESVISDEVRQKALQTIENTFTSIKKSNVLKQTYISQEEEQALMGVIQDVTGEMRKNKQSISLLTDILMTDDYTYQHSLNVAFYALAIGMEMKLSSQELMDLGVGALLHDIGKVLIDQQVLQKPGKLTDAEYEMVKKHTTYGYEFIRDKSNLSSVIAECAHQHHERLDGYGYPRGLKEDEIIKHAKIIAVADVFDAVTSQRTYLSKPMLPHEGLELLYAGSGKHFEMEMVLAFKNSISVYPNGITVELSNGLKGIVIGQNKSLCDRPVVRIESHDSSPFEIDLASELNITVINCYLADV